MIIKRDDKTYNVLEYLPDQNAVCVECEFDYATKPYKRKLELWWDLKHCEVIKQTKGCVK